MSKMTDGAQALGAVGGAFGAFIGDQKANEERRKQLLTLQAMYRNFESIRPEMFAEAEEAYNMDPSAFEGVAAQMDPATRNAQMLALKELQQVGLAGGMDPQSRAAEAQALAGSAQQVRAQQGALLNSFAARGMGGGGNALGAALAAQQGAAQTNAMGGLQSAADSRSRQLAALRDSASLAGQVRGMDYGQASDLAGARDRVAEYNTRNRQAIAGANIDRRYAAQGDTINNRFRRADGMAGTGKMKADYFMSEQDRKRRMGAAIGTGVGGTVGAVGGAIADVNSGGMGG
jgi:hypothetical protein